MEGQEAVALEDDRVGRGWVNPVQSACRAKDLRDELLWQRYQCAHKGGHGGNSLRDCSARGHQAEWKRTDHQRPKVL